MIINKILKFLTGPMLQSLVVIELICAAAFALFPYIIVNQIIGGFTVSAALLVLIRYGKRFMSVISEEQPGGPQLLISGIFLSAAGIAALKIIRVIEATFLGLNNYNIVTVQVIGPPLTSEIGTPLQLSPRSAVILALLCGTIFSVISIALGNLMGAHPL